MECILININQKNNLCPSSVNSLWELWCRGWGEIWWERLVGGGGGGGGEVGGSGSEVRDCLSQLSSSNI